MSNRCNLIRVAVTFATLAMAAPVVADSKLDEQRAISDGYSSANTNAGAQGRQGFVPGAVRDSSWLEQQRRISDGYSLPNDAAGTRLVYVGAKLETAHEDVVQRGARITDGTPE
jgi:hypothetical protein